MSKTTVKKRSTIKDNSRLAPPKGFDHSKYSGRWISHKSVTERSDGYEPRGFEIWKDASGNVCKNGDLVWGFMTKKDAAERKAELYQAAKDQIEDMIQENASKDDQLSFELEQIGGKIESKITVT